MDLPGSRARPLLDRRADGLLTAAPTDLVMDPADVLRQQALLRATAINVRLLDLLQVEQVDNLPRGRRLLQCVRLVVPWPACKLVGKGMVHLCATLRCAGPTCSEDAVGRALVAGQLVVELLLGDRLAQRQIASAGCLRGDSH